MRAAAEVELALVRLDQGRPDEAAAILEGALAVRAGGPLGPLVVGCVDAARSTLDLARGDLAGARRAAERMPPGFWREVALARALLADGALAEAGETLRPLAPVTQRQRVDILAALALADRDAGAAVDLTAAALRGAAEAGLYQAVLGARGPRRGAVREGHLGRTGGVVRARPRARRVAQHAEDAPEGPLPQARGHLARGSRQRRPGARPLG